MSRGQHKDTAADLRVIVLSINPVSLDPSIHSTAANFSTRFCLKRLLPRVHPR